MPRTEHKGSVFDLVSSADKERLSALKSRFEKSESYAPPLFMHFLLLFHFSIFFFFFELFALDFHFSRLTHKMEIASTQRDGSYESRSYISPFR